LAEKGTKRSIGQLSAPSRTCMSSLGKRTFEHWVGGAPLLKGGEKNEKKKRGGGKNQNGGKIMPQIEDIAVLGEGVEK